MAKSGLLIKPKSVIDKTINRKRFGNLVKEMQSKVKGVNRKKLNQAIKEAIEASKKDELNQNTK